MQLESQGRQELFREYWVEEQGWELESRKKEVRSRNFLSIFFYFDVFEKESKELIC